MISAKIIADSIAPNGKRLTSFELEYNRTIHAEFLTHKMVSKNSSSSRAIPIQVMIKAVWDNMAEPIHWGANQSGMQAKEELKGLKLKAAKALWKISGRAVCVFCYAMNKLGLHKQVANRILEPWSHIKVVSSATDWDNFFFLRNHEDAQPEIHELARQMWELYKNGKPKLLQEGEWHLPYLDGYNVVDDESFFSDFNISTENAIKLSASLCAQVSYRKSDESIEKAIKIYDRLVGSTPCHASPFEHQATPMENATDMSGNFRGWRQHRELIKNNVCLKYHG